MLKDKNILLAVCGGIAVYKVIEVASRLRKSGANVHVVMTKEATNFVAPLTFQEISGNPVNVSMWEKVTNWNVEHIALANLADLVLVAPATANIIGKIAGGIADDMLTTVIMATKAPVLLAPAMNSNMFTNPITQRNLKTLRSFGYRIIEPASGHLACGINGVGRLPEAVDLFHEIENYFAAAKKQTLAGKKVIVSAAGTREPIDPVRYISNRSSGKMGYAIAQAAADRGAQVVLVSGITNLPAPRNVKLIKVESAREMQSSIETYFPDCDITIMAAAVSDYRVKDIAEQKIKKSDEVMTIELVKNPDILKGLGEKKTAKQYLVGFAAETQNVLEYAQGKLQRKNLDMIVANDVSQAQAGFNVDTNIAKIITSDGQIKQAPLMQKTQLAELILDTIEEKMHKENC
ncbi:bifunctional phosphopantothenoylcysteine decarboxylase/phosphopantothenate--cysteine ligase CoaBC [Megamonas hypermegale]|uniref:bifunctional phosphopantothenoylcysteine decarboxylase/phosphopantothenate--cysteine ligase CoaBC n=1 Tax=Megamonas hypermegale TaxID=158847 RepID=UPI0026EEA3E1|nr:bifunctional phosphopantothenoylcysteine decarboxylase/phosphopantothenate--cysteine ligase CoaBC [Megamonas hypermegale]